MIMVRGLYRNIIIGLNFVWQSKCHVQIFIGVCFPNCQLLTIKITRKC